MILEKTNRGHGIEEGNAALTLLRDCCYKVDIHLMPNLPGSDPGMDAAMFSKVLDDEALQARAVDDQTLPLPLPLTLSLTLTLTITLCFLWLRPRLTVAIVTVATLTVAILPVAILPVATRTVAILAVATRTVAGRPVEDLPV